MKRYHMQKKDYIQFMRYLKGKYRSNPKECFENFD